MPRGTSHLLSLLHVLTVCTVIVGEPFYQHRDHRDQLKYRQGRTRAGNRVTSRDEAEAVLDKYGYLRCKLTRNNRVPFFRTVFSPIHNLKLEEEGGRSTCNEEHVAKALREYQRNYNLPETGELDEDTRVLMSSSRCGNKDKESESANPNATSVAKDNKDSPGSNPQSEMSGRNRAGLRESNKSAPPTQRLWRRSTSNSHLMKVLVGKPNKSSLVRRKRHVQEYIDKLKEIDSKILDPLTVSERKKRSVIVEAKHTGGPLPFWKSRDENGQMINKEVIRWRLLTNGYSTRIPVEDQRATIDLAFRMWSEVIPPKFVEDTGGDIRDVDIEIAFGRGNHQNCPHKFDGSGGEIAHSWKAGNMHFDDEENFKSIRSYSPEGIYLLRVAVHEIGHVLGLAHRNKSYSIMYAIYHGFEMQQPEFELGWEDRKAIQQIYGVCKGHFDTLFDWVRKRPDNQFIYNTYFFRQNRYWMYENHANRTRYGDPLYIAREWDGVPDGIDAYIHVWYFTDTTMANEAYFFKGEDFYRYDNDNDKVFDGYPKKISEGFPAKEGSEDRIPDNLDAVFFDLRDKNIYFFKDEYVYVYDPKEPEETRGCCVRKVKIVDEYPVKEGEKPLPATVDAVYYSYKDKAMYLFKDEEFWQNTRFHPRIKQTQNTLEYRGKWYEKWFDICDVTDME
ncbi:matrix metallopeptidase-21-like [Haliotis rufescens]|uniref:matrix metallopeptidase-21-like n=1 Tax=Haliotis rufescens TaxID=6454 RepID=UPI00201F98E5|nr:matrix metallopeptidase-21-like [Haliotis rufescens]XP_046372127.2 matrix metallopeptidase-21-like [Haliotis rufescens]XP_046372128.2 matrix metallopeptidase-21-like [Haliotis rufescens]XP_046372129.2 matrix metallopeptidase-21-like [Haliotis rufescens]XP_046372130.2 matrix metallopeptidase-21-like [Haliotis rufescens]XP_046372132.2 matrix metallopeptidase-21-like [Haliotis rufescens]XP_046372133.2 matrix metallopeptidase-21-like [Haliotis rufescens]XP_046372134.2 matrix metallopeptidase-